MKLRCDYRSTLRAAYLSSVGQAIAISVPPLLFLTFQDTYGIPLDRITLLITVNFLIQLLTDLAASRFVDRAGYRVCMVAGELLTALGLAGTGLLPDWFPSPYAGLMAANIVCAVGAGLIEVLTSPVVEACPTAHKESSMSRLHSFYCWGCVLAIIGTTAFFSLFGIGRWRLLCMLWAILPLANALNITRVPFWKLGGEAGSAPLRTLLSRRQFWLFALLMVCAGAAEQGMSQWASAFAESALGLTKAVGDLAGPCMFAILMGASRALYTRFHSRLPLTPYLLGSGLLCIASYLTAALAANPVLGLLGCGFCGFSVGMLWPGTMSMASARFPRGGAAMFALLSLGGDLGCSAGPTVVGLAASAAGGRMQAGLLAGLVFPILLLLGLLLCFRPGRSAPEQPE